MARYLIAITGASEGDVRSSAKVVVLGQTVVDNLFGGDPSAAVGKTIKIQRQSFRVVGTFAAKGSAGLGNQDNVAVVPISSAWAYLTGGRGKNIGQIVVMLPVQMKYAQPNTTAAVERSAPGRYSGCRGSSARYTSRSDAAGSAWRKRFRISENGRDRFGFGSGRRWRTG